MRILYVTQIVPYPPHGGVLQRGFNLLRELGREHEVHLLAFHHADELPPGPAYDESLRELGKFCRSVEYFPLWVKQSRVKRLMGFAAAAAYPAPYSVLSHRSGALAHRIAAICGESRRPDIVHLDTIALAPYARYCNGIPTVLAHHNVESQLMRRRAQAERNTLARIYVNVQADRLERYEKEQCTRFPLNIMVSENDARTLAQLVPGVRTAVIPNGVDTDYFHPRAEKGDPVMIYTGGMNMFANRDAVEWFLDSIWPRIKEKVPDAKFLAVGQRPSPRVRAAAAKDAAIEVPGFVPDVRPWVERASVYVVPLRVGGGTRLKVLDAMAQGKAIVSTRVGAEGIVGEHGAEFIFADDPDAFANAVVDVLRDKALRERLGATARARAESDYAWPMLGRRLAQEYARVLEERR
ncbi:MAG: glycosyltransferase [Xanthomonadaceae bacterium]|nr:glycosyltransferase [Xanthomonadaceae bacterium]